MCTDFANQVNPRRTVDSSEPCELVGITPIIAPPHKPAHPEQWEGNECHSQVGLLGKLLLGPLSLSALPPH